jgi:hypothetical protein
MKHSIYNSLFKVAIFHTYFENGQCNCLSVNLKPATSFLLKRFGFMVKNTTNGIEFYSNSSDVAALLPYVSQATGLTSFDFELVSNNDYFNYFTDLPMDWIGQLEYDSQGKLNKQEQNVITLVPKLNASVYQPIVGSLSIHFDELIKNNDQRVPLQFTISYKARATQWQYFIINKSAIKLVNPKIIGKSGIKFEGPQNITIENGEQAMLFSSTQDLIALSVLPAHKFDLIDAPLLNENEEINKNAMVKTIVKGLPTPQAERIASIKVETKLVLSPMYVYV